MSDGVNREHPQLNVVKQAFTDILRYFDKQETELSDALRLKKYEDAKAVILANHNAAVPFLADQFENASFLQKVVAYDLLIASGGEILDALKALLLQKEALTKIWLTSTLHFYRDFSRSYIFEELLFSTSGYIQHLVALAIVFQGRVAHTNSDALMKALISALLSDEQIEGSAFFIADSALSSIKLITGKRFIEGQREEVEFYNFNQYLFEPPVHPFPYTSDKVVTLSMPDRQTLASRVEDWWQQNREHFQLKETIDCYAI